MSYLVDTDWAADYLAGREEAVSLLHGLAEQGLAISIITYGEIYEGILFVRDRRQQESGFRRFLRGVDLLPLIRPSCVDSPRYVERCAARARLSAIRTF